MNKDKQIDEIAIQIMNKNNIEIDASFGEIATKNRVIDMTLKSKENSESLQGVIDQNLLDSLLDIKEDENLNIILDKYPGKLHMIFYSIEKFVAHPSNLISLTIKIGDKIFTSNKFPLATFVKPEMHLILPITEQNVNSLKIEVITSIHMASDSFSGSYLPTQASIEIKSDSLTDMQKDFVEEKLSLKPTVHFISKLFNNFFKSQPEAEPICRCYFTYIPDSDLRIFKKNPTSVDSLCKWVLFREMAFILMFQGLVNIKCERYSYAWKRKLIKWYGYMIFLMDPNDNTVEEIIDLSIGEPSIEILFKRIIRFHMSDRILEIECIDPDSFRKCTEALYTIFPRIFNLI